MQDAPFQVTLPSQQSADREFPPARESWCQFSSADHQARLHRRLDVRTKGFRERRRNYFFGRYFS